MTTDFEEKVRRHLGKGQTMKLGEDEFLIKPLTIEELTDWAYLLKELSKESKKKTDEELKVTGIIELMSSEVLTKAKELAIKTIELSYPDWEESLRKDFVMSNFVSLISIMFEINKFRTDTIDTNLVEKAKLIGNVQ